MQHPHGSSIGLLKSPQSRESQAVVSAEGDELWLLQELGEGTSLAELLEGGGHLCEGQGVVHRSDGDIAAVDDLGPVLVGVDVCARVEAPEGGLSA